MYLKNVANIECSNADDRNHGPIAKVRITFLSKHFRSKNEMNNVSKVKTIQCYNTFEIFSRTRLPPHAIYWVDGLVKQTRFVS
jgi:hypothetical protein